MMTGRERVKAALTFTCPDRVPRDLWFLPYVGKFRRDEVNALLTEFPMDIQGVAPVYPQDIYRPEGYQPMGKYKDEWGSVWYVNEPGVVGEVKEPALADWADLAHFKPPFDLIRRRDMSTINQQCAATQKFVLSECTVRLFERLQFLRGTENLFMDIAWGRRELFQLIEMLHEYYLEDLSAWLPTDVDAIMMMDDWGTNQSLLIHPKAWREIFKPRYKEYCDLIHSANKFVFFHSDGNIQSVYGDFVEIGVNALNSQLFTMDIEALARDFKGRITFWGEVDRQHLLPFGTPEEIKAAVGRVRSLLDDGSGGVIAQCEWGIPDPAENVRAVYEAWG
jgi:hypothetical protein